MKNSIEELEELVADSEDVHVPMDDCANGDIISKRLDYFKCCLGNDNMAVGSMECLIDMLVCENEAVTSVDIESIFNLEMVKNVS